MRLFFIIFALLYHSRSLSTFFVQDDFWLFLKSEIYSLSSFFKLFVPHADVVWYRPLSQQLFFGLGNLIFGLNPLPYHLLVMFTHLFTMNIFYLLLRKHMDKLPAVLAIGIYGFHQLHVISLSWLAAYSFVSGPLFISLVFYFFNQRKWVWAYLFFTLGVLNSELLMTTPILLWFYSRKYMSDVKLGYLFSYFIPIMLVICLRFVLFPTGLLTSTYSWSFDLQILRTTQFYLFRILGLPLGLPNMPSQEKITVLTLFCVWLGVLVLGLILLRKRKLIKIASFWILWFCISAVPVLGLGNHLASHYLTISLMGLSVFVAILIYTTYKHLKRNIRFAYLMIVLIVFFGLQYIGANWTYKSHWIFSRAKLAEFLVESGSFDHKVGSEEYFSLGADSAKEIYRKIDL